MIAIPNTFCIVGAFMGVFGLKASLVLNNGFNLLAAANGMLPYKETSLKLEGKSKEEEEEEEKEKDENNNSIESDDDSLKKSAQLEF